MRALPPAPYCWERAMDVAEYRQKADDLELLTRKTNDELLKQQYVALAREYRAFADEYEKTVHRAVNSRDH